MIDINYVALYGVVGFLLLMIPVMIEVIRSIYIDITRSVECVFIDTGRSKLIRNYRNKKTFKIKATQREYVCSETKVKFKKVFYYSQCAEPINFTFDSIDAEKTKFYVDSNEYSVLLNTKVIEKFNMSKEADMIKLVFYGVIAITIICIMIAYKVGAFSFSGA